MPRPSAPSVDSADEERHSASLDQIRAVIARLSAVDPVRGVSLDTLTNALKAEGFQRPPGSPRLVTRLRRIKDVELLPSDHLVQQSATIGDGQVYFTFDQPDLPAGAQQPDNFAFVNVARQGSDPLGRELGGITSRRILRCSPLTPVAPAC